MGSGGKKAHEAITVSPAPSPTVAHHAGIANLSWLHDQGDLGYEKLAAASKTILAGDLTPEELDQLKAISQDYLGGLSPEELHELAEEHGFEYPTLVGFGDHKQHPLVYWLDPVYPSDLESKAKIQAKAIERYQQLAAGETVHGLTLDDVESPTGGGGVPADELWEATPAEVGGLVAEIHQRAADLATHPYDTTAPQQLAQLIAVENKLQTAQCAEMGASLDELKASTALLVTATGSKTTNPTTVEALRAVGLLDEAEASWLSCTEAVALARYSSGPQQRADLTEAAVQRQSVINTLTSHKEMGIGTAEGFGFGAQSGEPHVDEFRTALKLTAESYQLTAEAWSWNATDKGAVSEVALHPAHGHIPSYKKNLTTEFRAWAKQRKLKWLRNAAEKEGLTDAKHATRAQIQNYLAARYDTTLDRADIQAKVSAKAGTHTAPTKKAAKAAKQYVAAASQSFGWSLSAIKAKLKAHQAVMKDLPKRVPSVAGHDWGEGTPFSKGSHQSTLHTGPDGAQWMFKPDKSAGGARAHAEAAASQVFGRVGVPAVGVHVTKIGKRTGSVQPLVSGAAPIGNDPTAWSQADVDAVVRLHVAAWVVGDHDGHSNNVLRSPSGGVFPVDQGQAFKFYGQDKLSADWHPQSNHGTPVYRRAYQAHKGGGLGPGVKVSAKAALPTIKAFEAIGDDEYRSMLRSTAEEGVKHDVHWVDAMRTAAKKRLGKTSVTDSEVAEEFLTTAVERKNNLRAAFMGLFSSLGVDDADHLAWVA